MDRYKMLITALGLSLLIQFSGFGRQLMQSFIKKPNGNASVFLNDTITKPAKNISSLFQDSEGRYWIASNGDGVYMVQGSSVRHFTKADGLSSDFVWDIQQDMNGMIWFTTPDGICRFDGERFMDYTARIYITLFGILTYKKGGVFLPHKRGVCFFDGKRYTNFVIHPPSYIDQRSNYNRPYAVYSTFADDRGRVFFGTQEKGVVIYDGSSYAYMDSLDLGGPAVRSIFRDHNGIYWFGNNGGGLFRFDGKVLRNITAERNLGNAEFLRGRRPIDKPGSLARVFAINEDRVGRLWIGTADAGVWKLDGDVLRNYTEADGLVGKSVTEIFKNRAGDLFFVSGSVVHRLIGENFQAINLMEIGRQIQ
jgi:ligand-binding sensor domain-containing protein